MKPCVMSSPPFYCGLGTKLVGSCITPLISTDAAVVGRSYRRRGTTTLNMESNISGVSPRSSPCVLPHRVLAREEGFRRRRVHVAIGSTAPASSISPLRWPSRMRGVCGSIGVVVARVRHRRTLSLSNTKAAMKYCNLDGDRNCFKGAGGNAGRGTGPKERQYNPAGCDRGH